MFSIALKETLVLATLLDQLCLFLVENLVFLPA
jgi:hypothetical protein